jgi:hypothetical protein
LPQMQLLLAQHLFQIQLANKGKSAKLCFVSLY